MIATIETELGYDESSNGRRRRPPKGEVSPEAFSPNINPQVELYIDHLGNLRCRTSFKLEQPLPESALITVSLKAKKRGAAATDPQMESGFARMFAKQNQTDYELSFPIYLGFEGTADGRVRVKHPNGDFVEVPFAIDIPSRKMKPADSDRPRAAKRANGRPRTKTETLPPVFVPEIPAIPADSTSETQPEQALSSLLLNMAGMSVEPAAVNETEYRNGRLALALPTGNFDDSTPLTIQLLDRNGKSIGPEEPAMSRLKQSVYDSFETRRILEQRVKLTLVNEQGKQQSVALPLNEQGMLHIPLPNFPNLAEGRYELQVQLANGLGDALFASLHTIITTLEVSKGAQGFTYRDVTKEQSLEIKPERLFMGGVIAPVSLEVGQSLLLESLLPQIAATIREESARANEFNLRALVLKNAWITVEGETETDDNSVRITDGSVSFEKPGKASISMVLKDKQNQQTADIEVTFSVLVSESRELAVQQLKKQLGLSVQAEVASAIEISGGVITEAVVAPRVTDNPAKTRLAVTTTQPEALIQVSVAKRGEEKVGQASYQKLVKATDVGPTLIELPTAEPLQPGNYLITVAFISKEGKVKKLNLPLEVLAARPVEVPVIPSVPTKAEILPEVKPTKQPEAELPQEALYSQTFGTNGVFRAEVFEKGDEHVLHLSGPALTEISVKVSQPDKTVVQRSELLGADGHAAIAVPKPLQPGEAEYLIKTGQTYLYFNGEDKPKLADKSQAVTSTTEHSFSVSLYEKEPKTSQAATTTEQRREKPTNERKSSRPQLDVTHSYEKGTITLVVTNKGGAMEMGAGWQATRQNPDYTSVGRYIKSVIAKGEVPALVDENQSHTIEFAVEPGATFYFSLYGRVPELIKVPELDVRN